MKVTEVSFGITVNLGNYESARFDATARVADDESPDEAMRMLKQFIKGEVNKFDQAHER